MTQRTAVPLYWCAYGPPASEAARILVLHGGPGAHHDYLLPQMLSLATAAGGRQLVFYDQRGGGRSKTSDQTPITWQTQATDVGDVVREFDLGDSVIAGYSWGGLLAMLYAADRARRGDAPPRALVLIDPAPVSRRFRAEFEAEFSQRQASPEIRRMREELAASGLRDRDPAAYRQRNFEISVAGYFADPRLSADLTPFRVMARVQQSVWDSLGDFDLVADGRLAAIRTPTLIVHGRQDPIPLASSQEAARVMGANLVVLDDCGHVPYVEQPRGLFAAIDDFLGRVS
ncbi:MAG TPA: alpha/beta fold hydrolase [Gemmatimonadaceae bacterium]|nr:alpha/beta fold hydrolase [Gemmatimonadaceae bacterium]